MFYSVTLWRFPRNKFSLSNFCCRLLLSLQLLSSFLYGCVNCWSLICLYYLWWWRRTLQNRALYKKWKWFKSAKWLPTLFFCPLCSLKKLCNEMAQKFEEIIAACDNLRGALVSQRTVRTDEAVRSCPSNIRSRRRKLKFSQETPFIFVISNTRNKIIRALSGLQNRTQLF